MIRGRIKSIFTRVFAHTGPALFFIFLFSVLVSALGAAQQTAKRSMTGSAARSDAPANLQVAPDLATHLARFKRVPMPFRATGLTVREQQMVLILLIDSAKANRFWYSVNRGLHFESFALAIATC